MKYHLSWLLFEIEASSTRENSPEISLPPDDTGAITFISLQLTLNTVFLFRMPQDRIDIKFSVNEGYSNSLTVYLNTKKSNMQISRKKREKILVNLNATRTISGDNNRAHLNQRFLRSSSSSDQLFYENIVCPFHANLRYRFILCRSSGSGL
jgi:hypothetical protein